MKILVDTTIYEYTELLNIQSKINNFEKYLEFFKSMPRRRFNSLLVSPDIHPSDNFIHFFSYKINKCTMKRLIEK